MFFSDVTIFLDYIKSYMVHSFIVLISEMVIYVSRHTHTHKHTSALVPNHALANTQLFITFAPTLFALFRLDFIPR